MMRRLLVGTVAVAVGLGVGGAIGLAAHGSPHPRITPASNTSPATSAPAPRPITPRTMLAWTFGSLPDGFAGRVAALPAVEHVVSVVSGTAWLTRSYSSTGSLVDRPEASERETDAALQVLKRASEAASSAPVGERV